MGEYVRKLCGNVKTLACLTHSWDHCIHCDDVKIESKREKHLKLFQCLAFSFQRIEINKLFSILYSKNLNNFISILVARYVYVWLLLCIWSPKGETFCLKFQPEQVIFVQLQSDGADDVYTIIYYKLWTNRNKTIETENFVNWKSIDWWLV